MNILEKVSIIIPAYNMEKYIARCLESVVSQDYDNIEAIVVNDGSTDRTLEICREYEQRDKRILVLTKQNGGVAEATNLGLDNQTGDYIMFLDSDDYLPAGSVRRMVREIQRSKADIVQSGVVTENEEGRVLVKEQFVEQEINGTNNIMRMHFVEHIVEGNLAQKIFKTQLFMRVRLPKGRNLADVTTMLDILPKCTVYKIIPDICYIAVKRENSVSMTKINDKGFNDLIYYINTFSRFEKDEYASYAQYAKIKALMMCYSRVYQSSFITNKADKKKLIYDLFKSEYIVIKKKYVFKEMTLINRIKIVFFALFPRLYASISVR